MFKIYEKEVALFEYLCAEDKANKHCNKQIEEYEQGKRATRETRYQEFEPRQKPPLNARAVEQVGKDIIRGNDGTSQEKFTTKQERGVEKGTEPRK